MSLLSREDVMLILFLKTCLSCHLAEQVCLENPTRQSPVCARCAQKKTRCTNHRRFQAWIGAQDSGRTVAEVWHLLVSDSTDIGGSWTEKDLCRDVEATGIVESRISRACCTGIPTPMVVL